MVSQRRTQIGSPYPQGVTLEDGGANFAVYSENAEKVTLQLFDRPDAAEASEEYELREVDDYVWHTFLSGVKSGDLYGYRVDGPYKPTHGLRFNSNKLLLDPYARALTGSIDWTNDLFGYVIGSEQEDMSFSSTDDTKWIPKCAVIDNSFDWRGVRRPRHNWNSTVIYETHVKGLTFRHPGVEASACGTYRGLSSPSMISYFKDLGITALELMPVHHRVDNKDLVQRGLSNYWGYNTIGFFAPDVRYSSERSPAGLVNEFKEMVRTLHENGIEVILDVVYNHTGEGNHLGPTLSFRGIDNSVYYRLAQDNRRYYVDFTGTGNTLNARHPQVLQLIMDSLRYWATEMRIDGFRFDLASTLARELYAVDRLSSFLDVIHQDPVISGLKLIAEPWDVGPGGYQVGQFPIHWAEWNGKYRDSVRHYWTRTPNNLGEFATRFSGSSDLYAANGRKPHASINYVTSHDGFTINDLVSYNQKHNEANLEGNRDGMDDNISHNMGVEGETDDPEINTLRQRRIRSLLITLLSSHGVPMLLGGDEIGRTQEGNNNAYCQDNETSWYNWDTGEKGRKLLEFTRRMIRIRMNYHVLRRRNFFQGTIVSGGVKDIAWFTPDGKEMSEQDWHTENKAIGILLSATGIEEIGNGGEPVSEEDLMILLNPGSGAVEFTVPQYWYSQEILIDSEPDNQPRYPIQMDWKKVTVNSSGAAIIRGRRKHQS